MRKKTGYDLFLFLSDLSLTGLVIYLIWNGNWFKGLSLLVLKATVLTIGRIVRLGSKEDSELDKIIEPNEDDINDEV